MSEPTANDPTRYEQPTIERRDTIAGLLIAAAPSDVKPKPTAPPIGISDVNIKENILPVRW